MSCTKNEISFKTMCFVFFFHCLGAIRDLCNIRPSCYMDFAVHVLISVHQLVKATQHSVDDSVKKTGLKSSFLSLDRRSAVLLL